MKPKDTDTNRTSCCKEQTGANQTDCCQGAENQTCYCREQEKQNQTGCCREQATESQEGCCGATHGAGLHHQLPNDDHEQLFASNNEVISLEQLQTLLVEESDKYLRLYAEFDNFKKRATKERMALTDKANERTLKELLPIADDFERCILALQGEQEELRHAEGIKLIYDKLCTLLKRFGVKEMIIEQGSAFDADWHEAIMQQPVDDLEMQGKVIAVVEKGYLINEYVLRFAKVVIGV